MRECAAVFNQLYLHSSGKVYPCSFLQNDPRYQLGDLTTQTLEDIWSSEKVRLFKESHLLLNEKTSCGQNQQKFLCDKIYTRPFYDNKKNAIKRIDVMLDSFCNLTCIMCTNIYDETGGFKKPFFWENNDELLSSLIEVELVGGEPLISPHFFRLVDKVLAVNPKCEWRVTTNANYPLTSKLKQTLSKLNFTAFAVSLDSLHKDVFELIRKDANHELVMSNIPKLAEHSSNFCINMVVQKSNYSEVFEMYEWCSRQGFHFFPILLTDPRTHSILSLPKEEIEKIALSLIEKNKTIKSKEIFLLIRSLINSTHLKSTFDILVPYQEHLMEFNNFNG